MEKAEKETRVVVPDDDRPLGRDADADGAVHVHAEGVSVNDTMSMPAERLRDPGLAEARRRFGGLDGPATLVGMLTALALVALIGGLIGAAIGAIGYQTGTQGNEQELSAASLAGGIVTLFLAFLVGGWTAARIARYDGVRNGVATGIWTLVLGAILAGLGAWLGTKYDVFRELNMPQWLSRDSLTIGAIASGVAAIAAMLLGGVLGGRWGERYHRRADAAILGARSGALAHDERELVLR